MKHLDIKDKIKQLNFGLEDISLGEFDVIGELCAKKMRQRDNPLFKTVGAYFRSNYERGILLYCLIKRFEAKKVIVTGFDRGYVSLCAAKAMCDMGWDDAAVYSSDVNLNEAHLKAIAQSYPREWFARLNLLKGDTSELIANVNGNVDIVYIDGTSGPNTVHSEFKLLHSRYDKYLLLNYDESNAVSSNLVDQLDHKELVISDRQLFVDDKRGLHTDGDKKYGQVIVKNPLFDEVAYLEW